MTGPKRDAKGRRRLTKTERAVMEFVAEFGGVDFGGRGANGAQRAAAAALLAEGLLTGSSQRAISGFTEAGWRLLQRERRLERRKKARQFRAEANRFA